MYINKKTALGNSMIIKLLIKFTKHFKIIKNKRIKEVTFFFTDQSCNTGNQFTQKWTFLQFRTLMQGKIFSILFVFFFFKKLRKITFGILILVSLALIQYY